MPGPAAAGDGCWPVLAAGDRLMTHSLPLRAQGAWAEWIAAAATDVAAIPDAVPFDIAAAMPVPALTAEQALRDALGAGPGATFGPVTVTVSAGNVVTVQLAPAAPGGLVFGIPFAIPPGPAALPGYARTSIATAGGEVDIDTVLTPPGSPSRFALPNLAIVSIHPPGPCHVRTNGTTVVFTPTFPPGPPN
jgi:hypothetical protein